MSVILTVTDTQTDTIPDSEPVVNGFQDQDEDEIAREAELVVFDGTTQGLGLKICGGFSVDGKQADGIFIKRILPGGLARLQGGLEEGDLILDVNGHNMEGITYDRALSILRQASASNHVEMVITRDDEAREAFTDLMSRYAANTSVSPDKLTSLPVQPTQNGEFVMRSDELEDYQSHMENFYKQTEGLRSDQPVEGEGWRRMADKPFCAESSPHQLDELNSTHFSPASSCNSEVVRHIPSVAGPEPVTPPRESSSHRTRSLDSLFHGVHPSCRFPIGKLEMTLQTLGFVISTQKHVELLKSIPIDSQGQASMDDFVRAVRQVFSEELQSRSDSQRSTPLQSAESPSPVSPSQSNGHLQDDSPFLQENERLQQQIESLREELKEQKQLCQKAEEQVLSLRKESQAAIEESRSLRTKLRLAEQSQEAARKTEQDYEQVVAMLENEISHLRLQMSKSDGINEHRRLAVAACQLKKAEAGKKTFEVATNKLLAHMQHVQDVLSSETSHSRDIEKGDKKKKKHKALQSLLTEGQDVIRSVQTLLEQVPLPFGWEENYTADGVRYYINHLNQTTSWTHPSSNVEHQSVTMTTGSGVDRGTSSTLAVAKRSDEAAAM